MNVCDVYDICIIGAGLYGAAAARHTSANPSLKVCLIGPNEPTVEELESREIFSSHYDEGRIVHTTDANLVHQNLARKSIGRFCELEKLSGIHFYEPVGILLIGKETCKSYRTRLQALKSGKTPFVNLSSHGNAWKNRFPFLNVESDDPVFSDAGSGHVSPRKMIEAQKNVARLQGCSFLDEVVCDIRCTGSTVEIVTDSGRIVKSKRVLICTGAFTNFKNLGPAKKLKIDVNKETAAMLMISAEEKDRLSSMPTMIADPDQCASTPERYGAYILPPIQYPDGEYYLKIGHMNSQPNAEMKTLEEIKAWYTHNENPEILDLFPKWLLQILPGLKTKDISTKNCVTCSSPSGLPYIDRITPNITVAVVGNGKGASICEEVGRIASQLCITGQWDSDLPKSLFKAIFEDH